MKKIFILLLGFTFLTCRETKMDELPAIPVDVDQNMSLSISAITEEIKAIELELTDESMINPDRILRILLSDNHVIVAERDKILLFNMDGTFVRSIGNRGQGPGEYVTITNLTVDRKNNRLFVGSNKIISYDLNGNLLKESPVDPDNMPVKDINYINDELLIMVEQVGKKDSKGSFQHSVVYKLNEDLQIIDSCTIRDTYFEQTAKSAHIFQNFLLFGNDIIFLYYSDIYSNRQVPSENVLRDTLYTLKNNHLFPELKLKFKNDGVDGYGNKFIQLYNVYRSSRYVFAFYRNDVKGGFYHFCYDMKTGTGFNMQDGYTDDINKIEKPLSIRPINTNTELFYYWHTHMSPDDIEEPNPTLYIGKLKN